MHFMIQSATTPRERRRQETEHRICVAAQRLAEARGLDGFTMDELAEDCEVSRRTLFNYFPSKLDAVLGAVPELDATVLASFHGGGPHGNLFDDLGAVARSLLEVSTIDRESIARGRRLMASTPRLLAAAHERFEQITSDFVSEILTREGADFDPARARLAVRVTVVAFDASLDTYLADLHDRPLADLFDETLRDLRSLFA